MWLSPSEWNCDPWGFILEGNLEEVVPDNSHATIAYLGRDSILVRTTTHFLMMCGLVTNSRR